MSAGNFVRDETNKLKRLGLGWKKPRGIHSKRRLHRKGHAKLPSPGFGRARAMKNRIDNLIKVRVSNKNELKNLDPKIHLIEIGSRVGLRKKLALLKEISKMEGFKILNVKHADEFIRAKQDEIEERKNRTKLRIEQRKKAKENAEKKKAEEEKKADSKEESKEESKEGDKEVGKTEKDKTKKKQEEIKEKKELTKKLSETIERKPQEIHALDKRAMKPDRQKIMAPKQK